MPNWCMNKLNVKGDADAITEFIETILVPKEDEAGFLGIEPFFDEGKYRELTPSDEVDFSRAHPMPEILQGTRAPAVKRETFEKWKADKDHFGHATEGWFEEQEAMVTASEEAMKETGFDNWYDWAWQHWGTKWSPDVELIEAVQHFDNAGGLTIEVYFEYETAWSPCQGIITAMAEKFPKLTFVESYDEPGVGFYGSACYKDGTQIADICEDYDDTPELQAFTEKYGLDPEESIVSEDEFYETQNDIICTVRDNVTDRVKALL